MGSALRSLTSRRKLATQVLRLMIAVLIFFRCNRSAGTVLSWAVRPCRDDCGPNVRNDKRSLKLLFLSIHEFRGEQYAFQDLAVESFEINPVVQQQLLTPPPPKSEWLLVIVQFVIVGLPLKLLTPPP